MRPKALVTGAAGFVGSNLCRRLLEDGWQVHGVVRSGARKAAAYPIPNGVRRHATDGEFESLSRIVRKSRPDVVFHLAALFISEHGPRDIEPLLRSNVIFGTQLAEAMSARGSSLLVNTGTSWQHYLDSEYAPVNLYAATKQAFESILEYYRSAGLLKTVTLELFDTYGECDRRPKLFAALRRATRARTPFSPGGQFVDLVHVDDVVSAYVIAGRRLLQGKVRRSERYAVSSGSPIRLRSLAALFEKAAGLRLLIDWGARPYREREVFKPWRLGRSLPGWKPRVSLESGLRRMTA